MGFAQEGHRRGVQRAFGPLLALDAPLQWLRAPRSVRALRLHDVGSAAGFPGGGAAFRRSPFAEAGPRLSASRGLASPATTSLSHSERPALPSLHRGALRLHDVVQSVDARDGARLRSTRGQGFGVERLATRPADEVGAGAFDEEDPARDLVRLVAYVLLLRLDGGGLHVGFTEMRGGDAGALEDLGQCLPGEPLAKRPLASGRRAQPNGGHGATDAAAD